jgi:pimeloyl-ACP methyl ester carboxylesterase
MARHGYVAAAVSQPGYGNSSGPPDYCVPYTQQATLVAIDFLRRQPFVRPDKVALFGYSRGAIVAAMVATLNPKLAAVVLGAGAYDFFTWRPTLPGISRNLLPRQACRPRVLWRVRRFTCAADQGTRTAPPWDSR